MGEGAPGADPSTQNVNSRIRLNQPEREVVDLPFFWVRVMLFYEISQKNRTNPVNRINPIPGMNHEEAR